MTLYDFRPRAGFRPTGALHDLGGDYVEFDEILASGCELAVEEDAGALVLIESDGSE